MARSGHVYAFDVPGSHGDPFSGCVGQDILATGTDENIFHSLNLGVSDFDRDHVAGTEWPCVVDLVESVAAAGRYGIRSSPWSCDMILSSSGRAWRRMSSVPPDGHPSTRLDGSPPLPDRCPGARQRSAGTRSSVTPNVYPADDLTDLKRRQKPIVTNEHGTSVNDGALSHCGSGGGDLARRTLRPNIECNNLHPGFGSHCGYLGVTEADGRR